MNSVHRSVLVASIIFLAAPAFADKIELKDGRVIEGSLSRQGDRMFIKGADGVSFTVAPDEIVKVTLTGSITPAQAAEAEWTRVNAAVRKTDDFKTALDLLEKYIAKHGEQPAAAAAKKQVEDFRKIAAENPVKFRGTFMPAKQAETLQRLSEEKVRPAIEAYRAGKIKEALDTAKEVLKTDDENARAHTIAGLASYRLNYLPAARNHFSKLADLEPENILALNNLAVVNAQTKSDNAACLAYTRAMTAAPENRLLVDNVIEYLNANPGLKSVNAYKDMMRIFEQAEARVQAQMAKSDLYRFGSTWLKKADAEKLASRKQQITEAMAQLDSQYKSTLAALQTTDAELKQTTADYNATINDILFLNNSINANIGRGVDVTPLLVRRDALSIDADRLNKRRVALELRLKELQESIKPFYAEAERLKIALAAVTSAQFTGLQRIIDLGEERDPPAPTPVVIPSSAGITTTTAPAPGTKIAPYVQAELDSFDTYRNRVLTTGIGVTLVPPVIISPTSYIR